jgi:hypothetical protein
MHVQFIDCILLVYCISLYLRSGDRGRGKHAFSVARGSNLQERLIHQELIFEIVQVLQQVHTIVSCGEIKIVEYLKMIFILILATRPGFAWVQC